MLLFDQVKEILRSKLPASTYTLWIEPLLCLDAKDDTLVLGGPDKFFTSWVAVNYKNQFESALQEMGKDKVCVQFQCREPEKDTPGTTKKQSDKTQLRLPAIPPKQSSLRPLHPRYTFEEFMVGECNALAKTACASLAEGDMSLGRSIFIDAGTGLGKSHLTHAVAHQITNQSPHVRLHYLTAQQLTAEMVKAIKANAMEDFKNKYQNQCDVLLMEDVHSLAGRVKTQEELTQVLDILMETGKRIIFTSKTAPRNIENIEEGFRSRLSAGLITSINPPDHKTRTLIVKRKAQIKNLILADELIGYLAEHIKGDIRKIESAIVGLKAKSTLLKTNPDMDMVKEVVANIIGRHSELSAEIIRDFLAKQFKISVDDLISKTRKKSIAVPRQISMFLARKLTDQGLAEIGRAFNRDHSTVVHSIRVVTDAMARNGSMRGQVDLLTDKIKNKYLV